MLKTKEIEISGQKYLIRELNIEDIIYMQENFKEENNVVDIGKKMIPRCLDKEVDVGKIGISELFALVKIFGELNKDFLEIAMGQKKIEMKELLGLM